MSQLVKDDYKKIVGEKCDKLHKSLYRKKATPAGIFQTTSELFYLLKRMGVRRTYFLLSTLFAFVAAGLAALEIGLMIPLLRGILHKDYEFISNLPGFGQVVSRYPEVFDTLNSRFLLIVFALFAVALLNNVVTYLSTLSIQQQVRVANINIRKLVFKRFLTFGKLFFDRNGVGPLNTILMGYTQSISRQLRATQRLLGQMFALSAYTIMVLLISWKLTLITLLIFPIMNYLSSHVVSHIRKVSGRLANVRKQLDNKIFNILSNIPLVKVSVMEEEEQSRFAETSEREADESFRIERLEQLIQPIQNLCTLAALLVVAFSLGAIISAPNAHSASSYLVFFFIVRRMVPGFNAINKFGVSLATASGGITPVFDIINDDEDKHIVRGGSREFMGLKDSIEFRNLSFGYYPGLEVLRGVSFTIESGKTTAIVGATGSGKTTLVSLILRFYDCGADRLLIDGRDIREYDLVTLRRRMAFVSQDTLLFNDTLRSNMCYGNSAGSNSDEDIMKVARLARLDKFIEKLPDGLNTVIGEKGIQLSGGEKQRVSIARALYKGADILILDEATSSLDSKTEKLIQDAVDDAIDCRTAIVIAHRLSTIRQADKIIVMDNGKLVEQGSVDDLVAKRGVFHELWETQKFI